MSRIAETAWVPHYPDSRRDNSEHRPTRVPVYPAAAVAQLPQLPSGTGLATSTIMPAQLHLVLVRDAAPAPVTKDDPALRPTSFDTYVGQTEVVSNLRGAVRAATRGGWQLDHVLLAGPAGLGKTSMAQIIATELGVRCHVTSAPAIEHKGALASLLTALEDGDVLFIDEIHALDRKIAETIYTALEDRVLDMPAGKRVIRVPLAKFTLVGATTHAGKLPKPLLDRFGITCQLRPYTVEELSAIVAQSADKLGVTIDLDGAEAIARASRGTPRVANKLLRRVRDAAANAAADGALVVRGRGINSVLVHAALAQLGVDCMGLGPLDRRYLAVVADRPVGIEAICAELGEDRSTVEDAVEPWLVQAGFVQRGGKGRMATEAGRAHLVEVAS